MTGGFRSPLIRWVLFSRELFPRRFAVENSFHNKWYLWKFIIGFRQCSKTVSLPKQTTLLRWNQSSCCSFSLFASLLADTASSVTHALPTRVGLNVIRTRKSGSVNPVRTHVLHFMEGVNLPISISKAVVSKQCATAQLPSVKWRYSSSARFPAAAEIYAIEPKSMVGLSSCSLRKQFMTMNTK